MNDLDENKPMMGKSSCAPAFTVVKIDSLFKRMLETINREIGSNKKKIAQWEENIRKRFNL